MPDHDRVRVDDNHNAFAVHSGTFLAAGWPGNLAGRPIDVEVAVPAVDDGNAGLIAGATPGGGKDMAPAIFFSGFGDTPCHYG